MEGEVVLEHHHSEYTLDIAVPGLQLAIEADGPLHFMQNQPMATGRTMCKYIPCMSDTLGMHYLHLLFDVDPMQCFDSVGSFH